LTSILCLSDGEVLPLALKGLPVGRTTAGHRFLSPGEICVGSAAEYLGQLEHACVILDQGCSTRSPASPNSRSCSPGRSTRNS
jgi:glycyl-tRNA synthetase beta chain